MKPLAALTHDDVAPLRGLLFDLDDTLLSHGVLTREAYDAIWSLHEAGLRLVAVTGRPASWGELVARQWPIDAAITENGAIALVREGRSLSRIDGCDATERRSRRARLASIVERAREIVPEARLADDVDGRISDVAWDIGERVKLPASRVEALAEVVRFVWNYYRRNPEFIALLNDENLHRGRHLSRSPHAGEFGPFAMNALREVLDRGAARGLFRRTVTPRDLYLLIAALGYFYLSNRYTLSAFFGERTDTPEALAYWERFMIDAVRRTLAPPEALPPIGPR